MITQVHTKLVLDARHMFFNAVLPLNTNLKSKTQNQKQKIEKNKKKRQNLRSSESSA